MKIGTATSHRRRPGHPQQLVRHGRHQLGRDRKEGVIFLFLAETRF